MYRNVEEFRGAVVSESSHLSGFCSTWRAVIEEDAATPNESLTEDIVGDINVAIGQAELLKRERFKQFNGLIDDCEFKTGEKETTIQDLQGFWDIIFFQVEDIRKKFDDLNRLRTNNWQKQQPRPPVILKKKPMPVKKVIAPKISAAPRPSASSSIRAHILAARNKLNKIGLEDSTSVPQQPSTVPHIVLQSSTNTGSAVTRSTPTKTRPAPCDKENIDSSCQSGGGKTPPAKEKDAASKACSAKPLGTAVGDQIQTPCKTKLGRKEKVIPKTPDRSRSTQGETRLLASSILKERVQRTPVTHKDYSPCMRITRSMKKSQRPTLVADHSP